MLRKPRTPLGWVTRLVIGLPLFLMLMCCGLMLIYVIFPPAPLDILVLGVDAREGEGMVTRTDSIMLIGVNSPPRQVSLLSIPRDLFISVPGYGSERVNIINVLGEMEEAGYGPELLKQSIALSFAVQPDRYVRLDFEAFEALIDAVGGVTINIERAVNDDFYPTEDYGTQPIRFDVGKQHMDGATALIYARTRHGDDDYFRANRQQQILSAFSGKLLNPLNWPAVIGVINRYLDTDLSPLDLIKIAPAMLLNAGNFERLVIDREYIRAGANGAVPDYEKLSPWIEAHFD